MQFVGQVVAVPQRGVVGVEKGKALRGFGTDITNDACLQKSIQAPEVGKKCADNGMAKALTDARSLRQLVRNFVRVEWKAGKSEAARNQGPAPCTEVASFDSAKLSALLEGTTYKLPYIHTSQNFKRKKRGKAERAAFRKQVVMSLEKDLQAMISGRKIADDALRKGTGCVWETDALGDYVYYNRSTKEKIGATEYCDRYNDFLRVDGERSDPMLVYVDVEVETVELEDTADTAPVEPSDGEVEVVAAAAGDDDAAESAADSIQRDYELAVEKAQFECWRSIQGVLKAFESTCNNLRTEKRQKLAMLGKTRKTDSPPGASFNFFSTETQGIGPRSRAVDIKRSMVDISERSIRNSRQASEKKRKKKKRKEKSNRRRSIVKMSHVPSFSDEDSDEALCSQVKVVANPAAEECSNEGATFKAYKKKSKRRRSLCKNFEVEDMMNEDKDDDYDMLF